VSRDKGQIRIPKSLRQFVERQTTTPFTTLWEGDWKEERSPYGRSWYRAVACLLMSGRIQAKFDDTPNMTDVNRVGKEANFNQYLIERIGTFLVAMGVIQFDRQNRYDAGPNLVAFWGHDEASLPAIARQAVLRLVGHKTDHPLWHPKAPEDSCLIEFLSLFFMCFRGLALVESKAGRTFQDFARLPEDDLIEAARGLEIASDRLNVAAWRKRLDARGQKALVAALSTSEWTYHAEAKKDKTAWCFASPTGLAMLGLEPSLPTPELANVFKVQPDLSVFAGAGLAWETLVPLFRYSTIKRIDQIFEFRLDRKKLAGTPATGSPGEELREAFREFEPLPPAVADLLATKSKAGGKLGIRWCSALVKPESTEILAAIREHPKLKGYLEPGAPPGYLLIKSQSDPGNFVRRCQDLGFKVETL
jgi:hypothetical protein